MNGAHDLGGMHGLGPILREADEPAFHGEWERRVFALTLAMGFGGLWNIDMARYARERQHPRDYLGNSYYENWLQGLTTLLIETGVVTPEELKGEAAPAPPIRAPRVIRADEVMAALARGGPCDVDLPLEPRFAVGEAVRVKVFNPRGHTRAPRYLRGRQGTVARDHGVFIFPDANAKGEGPAPQHLYNVGFSAEELWGESEASAAIHVDLFEPYLEPAARSGGGAR
jgi:nitrile hydratase